MDAIKNIIANDIITILKSHGVIISDEIKSKAIETLISPKMLHIDRMEFVKSLEIDIYDKDLVKRILKDRKLFEVYGKLLRIELIKENRELFDTNEIKFIDDKLQLNDYEITGFGLERIKQIIDEIICDENTDAAQGDFWNILISKDKPYVIKTERKLNDIKLKNNRSLVSLYPIIKKYIGKEFFPKQAVLQVINSKQIHILQERILLSKAIIISVYTIDDLIMEQYGSQIIDCLKDEGNRKKLKDFIVGVRRLYKNKRLMIDMVGDNLFFILSDNGKLDIKIVDYGVFRKGWGRESFNIKRAKDLINKLEFKFLKNFCLKK